MSSPQIKHEEASLVINKDDNFEYQHTIDYLGENGYIRVSNVRETGEFSVKGDVIDIFPSGYDNPVRVDTFGNEIEKLQIFNLKDQKPIDDIKRLIVYPFNEFLFNQNNRKISADSFLTDLSTYDLNDLIVHVDHGIGRFKGLQTIPVLGSNHECVEIHYSNDDKLFIPVENIELLSKYGGKNDYIVLDRLGATQWQYRKAVAKNKIKEMAAELIKTAASRTLETAPKFFTQEPYYSNFNAEFPFDETEDQIKAIAEIHDDLVKGTPMDRLICGDVGYGKTEVAIRAAFTVALSGHQVAILVPTTLLCRQHHENLTKRFSKSPIKVAQLSRLVSSSEANETIDKVSKGEVDILIGTHAILSDKINFKKLGLLIIDEEQHFGVKQKEKLKTLRTDVHILSLTATPIPRTLQMSLVGLRELSIISTAPVNRQSIKTKVVNFDSKIIKDAIKNEISRNGQLYYVCPRVKQIEEVEEFLKEEMPEVSYKVAHGQMPAKGLESVMVDFYNHEFSILLCTTIVESGLDLRNTNTMIIHNSDNFGLSQLYQLRGRIGRSNTEAFCYYTIKDFDGLTDQAKQRLKLLQKLDSLGSGFNLASHDLDIRGSGNILGDDQSGHIREIGLELYHRLLKEKIQELQDDGGSQQSEWSPQINLGIGVLIPTNYIGSLNTRLSFYRKLAYLNNKNKITDIKDEMIVTFGDLPKEVENLFTVTELRSLCKKANIEKVELGQKGGSIKFKGNKFSNPDGLVSLIQSNHKNVKLRPDQSLIYMFDIPRKDHNIERIINLVKEISEL